MKIEMKPSFPFVVYWNFSGRTRKHTKNPANKTCVLRESNKDIPYAIQQQYCWNKLASQYIILLAAKLLGF
jgi:hypothetical protein